MNIPELKVMKDPEVFGEIFKVVKGPYCWGKPYLDLEAGPREWKTVILHQAVQMQSLICPNSS